MAETKKKRTCTFIMVMVTNHVTTAGDISHRYDLVYTAPEYNEEPEEMTWTVKLCGPCLNVTIHEHDERNINRRRKKEV